MPMTKEQEEAVLNWASQFKPKCPVCQADAPNYFKEFFTLSQAVQGAGKITGSDLLFVGLTCRACGFLWLVDASVARIPKDKK